jgi:hypothetical protein
MHPTAQIYRQILTRTAARYLTVRPHGLQIAPGHAPRPQLRVQILDHGAARTLYRERKPVCRSLDAIVALCDPERRCNLCADRDQCTPQVRIDLVFDCLPYRLLLAYTSAKNFLLYHTETLKRGHRLPDLITEIRVLNRGNWGELRFSTAPSHDNATE